MAENRMGQPPLRLTVDEVIEELMRARAGHSAWTSYHQGLGVIQEEVHELMLEVYKRPVDRDKQVMRREACQIAAAAINFMEELT